MGYMALHGVTWRYMVIWYVASQSKIPKSFGISKILSKSFWIFYAFIINYGLFLHFYFFLKILLYFFVFF
jgi:hypothetical protein